MLEVCAQIIYRSIDMMLFSGFFLLTYLGVVATWLSAFTGLSCAIVGVVKLFISPQFGCASYWRSGGNQSEIFSVGILAVLNPAPVCPLLGYDLKIRVLDL